MNCARNQSSREKNISVCFSNEVISNYSPPSTSFFHQLPSSINFLLPSTSFFHQLPSSINFLLPSTSFFHQLPSSINFLFPSTSFFHQLPSSITFCYNHRLVPFNEIPSHSTAFLSSSPSSILSGCKSSIQFAFHAFSHGYSTLS